MQVVMIAFTLKGLELFVIFSVCAWDDFDFAFYKLLHCLKICIRNFRL